jgi:hypothetical protein
MPMPHRTQLQLIKRRLAGKEGAERVREPRAILAELPGYRSGPYADLRKCVNAQIWRLTGLVWIALRDGEPVALRPPVNVHDVARTIHHELAALAARERACGVPRRAFRGSGSERLMCSGTGTASRFSSGRRLDSEHTFV